MTLPASGAISLFDVNDELGLTHTASIGLLCTNVRTLFGTASGAVGMTTGYGKSNTSVPGAPTSVSGSATSSTVVSVSFSAPACNGHLTIDYYQAISSPGCFTATGSSPISVTGLSASTSYTFRVRAHNSKGYGCYSSASGSVTTQVAPSSQSYTTPGTYTWVAPDRVTNVSVVAVGGGAGGGGTRSYSCCTCGGYGYGQYPGQSGGGGGLAWINNYSVTPGNSYTVVVGAGGTGQPPAARGLTYYGCVVPVGGSSYFVNNTTVKGGGAGRNSNCTIYACGGLGGHAAATGCIPCRIGLAAYSGRSGLSGGGGSAGNGSGLGGGGAGGYGSTCYVGWGGDGCRGGCGGGTYKNTAQNGGGGGGGSYIGPGAQGSGYPYGGGGGGGVGVSNGKGCSGFSGNFQAGSTAITYGGKGSGGCNGGIAQYLNGSNGGLYGGGGGAAGFSNYPGFLTGNGGNGANGVVRIIWPGSSRKFPSTCVGSP